MTGVRSSRFAARLVILIVALVAVGCGEGDSADEAVRQSGRLVVEKSSVGLLFTEGSVTHLRIVSEDGEEIINGLRPIDTLDVPLFDREVPAGTYDVAAVERPCQGNCEELDPPVAATRCELEVAVRGNQTTRVAIVLSDASGDPDSDCSATTGR